MAMIAIHTAMIAVTRIVADVHKQFKLIQRKVRKLQESVSERLSWCHSPHVLALYVDLKPSSILPAAGPPMPRDACPGDESFSSSSDLKPDRRPNSDRRFEDTLSNVEFVRKHLLLVAVFLASCSYSIGLSSPGGCWDETQHHSYSHGSSDDVDFPTSGGIDVTFGSHTVHVLRHLSIHKPLIQMLLFTLKRFVDTFACVKSMVPRRVFDMARRLRSYAAPNVRESGWVSGKPNSEFPSVVALSEFNPRNGIHRSSGLTEKESRHPSDPDSYGKPATWVISAAAPHHATGNHALLSGFITKHDDLFVHAVDETPLQVVARGTVVTDDVTLPDVWFVPGLMVNLLSVSQLVGLDYSVEFGHGMCYIRQRASDGTIVGKAHLRNRLYVLDFLKVPLDV